MNSEIKTTRDLIAALNELEERLPEFEAEELVEVYDLVDSMADISRNKRMKSLQSQITALTAERDAAREKISGVFSAPSMVEADKLYNEWSGADAETVNLVFAKLGQAIIAAEDGAKKKIDSLTAELAALKSAPGMAEVDALVRKILRHKMVHNDDGPVPVGTYESFKQCVENLADLARRSIASEEFQRKRAEEAERELKEARDA